MSKGEKLLDPVVERAYDEYYRQLGYESLEQGFDEFDEEISRLRGKSNQEIQEFMESKASGVKDSDKRDELIDFIGDRISNVRMQEGW